MDLEKERELQELHQLKHRHDNIIHKGYNWEENLLKKTTSPYIWKNPVMHAYLTKLEKILVLMVSKMHIARNYFNFTVDKYDKNHWG